MKRRAAFSASEVFDPRGDRALQEARVAVMVRKAANECPDRDPAVKVHVLVEYTDECRTAWGLDWNKDDPFVTVVRALATVALR